MEWLPPLAIIVGLLLLFMLSGMPVALAFILVNFIGFFFFISGSNAWVVLPLSAFQILTSFSLLPIAFFVLMGEILYYSGTIELAIDVVDNLLGAFRARLSLLAIGAGTLMGMLTGSALGSCAALGTTLLPEMDKRGYRTPLTLGPIMGAGGLAMLIPPSAMAVILATIAKVSIGKVLMAGFMPGLLLGVMYSLYIIIRIWINPDLAPVYKPPPVTLARKARILLNLLPMGILVFLVLGTIFLGMATPTEASALGVMGAFAIAASYRKLNRKVLVDSVLAAAKVTGMIFLIVMASKAFSQLLAGTGVSAGVLYNLTALDLNPWVMLIAIQLVLLIMGMIMDGIAMMMIAIPIFMPLIIAYGFDPIWFAILFLINIEVATLSPPFGLTIFVMKGIVPPKITLGDIYLAAFPFMLMEIASIGIIMVFPQIALWLPELMR